MAHTKKTGRKQKTDNFTDGAREIEHTPKVQAKNSSVAVGNVDVGGSVEGPMVIGSNNVIGLTAEQAARFMVQLTESFTPKSFDGTCPYKGLEVFKEQDAELFFGREKLVAKLINRAKASRIVFITGPSGCGKSSLVRAGLIPALKRGGIKEKHSEYWLYSTIKPGRDPIEALATAFSRLKDLALKESFLKISSDANALHECAEAALTDDEDQRLVLFIDQFEEIFTQLSPDKAMIFINMLDYAASNTKGRINLLFSMRSDFVPSCAFYPKLNTLLSDNFIQIGMMEQEELASSIAQPALRVGLRIDPGLVAQIVNDMQGQVGALPLMQVALVDLFESQKGKGGIPALKQEDYLARGGLYKALDRHAQSIFDQLTVDEKQHATFLFRSLVEIGSGTPDTKRTLFFEELIPAGKDSTKFRKIIDKLADVPARLITLDEINEKLTITLSHDKLISAWTWLKKLVKANRDAITVQNDIINDAREWKEHRRNSGYLYRGARLLNVKEKIESNQLVLSGLAVDFIKEAEKNYINELEAEKRRTKHLEELNRISLARQLAAQAQSINYARSSKQMIAILLATQSMKLFPTSEAAQLLLTNTFYARSIAHMTHDGFVNSVDFSLDGWYVVSGSEDNTARVWEAATGKELARMSHERSVDSVAFNPDCSYVVSGGGDKTARVWEAVTGDEIARMTHDDRVRSVVFSPDGRYVVSGSDDNTARVWEAATGKELARMTHDDRVSSVAFSLDGRYVVSGSYDNTARVWEAATGKELARMTHNSVVYSVAFSPDGRTIGSSDDYAAWVGEAATGRKIARMIHDRSVTSLTFSPDSRYVVSGGYDNTARVWEVATSKEIIRITHDGFVHSVAFSPDGRYVVSGSEDHTARVWETATGEEIVRITHDGSVRSVAFSLNGSYVVSGSEDNTARIWETATGRKIPHMMHNGTATSVVFSPDGRYVLSESDDNTAQVWEATTGKEIARMTHNIHVNSVVFSPDGRNVVSGGYDNTARVWEAATGKEIACMIHDGFVNSVAFGPDGRYVVSGSMDNTARIWEAATGKEIARMTHNSFVNLVAFSPNGRHIVSEGGDKTARVWEAATGRKSPA